MNGNIASNDKANDSKVDCSSYVILRAEQLDRAFSYVDLEGRFKYGSLRNTLCKLVKDHKILKLPHENPARFILPRWSSRPEYCCMVRNDKKGIGDGSDFLSLLEGLKWDSGLAVHGLKLSFAVYSLQWIGRDNSWDYCERSRSYRRKFNLSHPVSVQCFDTGTVLVSVSSSVRPFRLDSNGLIALTSLLGEVRASLPTPAIPEPLDWVVVQWHLNRDSEEISGSGLNFQVAYRTFFDDLWRAYFKCELRKVRVELIEQPHKSLREIFETVLNRMEGP